MTPIVSIPSSGRSPKPARGARTRGARARLRGDCRALPQTAAPPLPALPAETRAEDAVQQTFLNAWSALGSGAQIEDLRAWLYRISRNAALDAAKRAGYDYSQLSDAPQLTPAPDDEVERRWVVRETWEAWRHRPPANARRC